MSFKLGGDSYQNPKPGYTYISPSLDSFGAPGRKIRIATKALDHEESFAFAQIKGELVLRHSEGAKSCIKAKFFEDDRGVYVLNIQGYTFATMKPHNASFSFRGDEIGKLVEFINHIQSMPLKHGGPMRIADEDLTKLVLSRAQVANLLRDNEEVFNEVVRQALTKEDVVAIGYRKKQLKTFERLLEDETYFAEISAKLNCGEEALWQKFFEKNPWIFGYGLRYVYLSGWDGKKLEQIVSGHRIFKDGKRADALLRTRGALSNLCFVEIKKHTTDLVDEKYRSGCWSPSAELAGAVAQVQGTVALAASEIRTKLAAVNNDGDPTGEDAYNYIPKSFLIVGNLKEFNAAKGVNEGRHRSFELFRGNLVRPEIITFDELYERARFIVHQHEAG
jgi:hypothetical protein